MFMRPKRFVRSVGRMAALVVGLSGCADRNIGDVIPPDQLYYPFGMVALDDQRLAVLSTNADQRFRTQQVTLVHAERLVNAVLEGLGVSENPEDACQAAGRPLFAKTLNVGGASVVLARARIPGVGAELLATDDDNGGHWLYATDRFDAAVYAIHQTEDTLSCALEGEDLIEASDCSPSFRANTGADDPFALARGTYRATLASGQVEDRNYIAVGHLQSVRSLSGSVGIVTTLDQTQFVAQTNGEQIASDETFTWYQGPLFGNYALPQHFGIGGLVHVPGRAETGRLLVIGRTVLSTDPLRVVQVEVTPPLGPDLTEDEAQLPLFVPDDDFLDLGNYTHARESYGMTLYKEATRMLVSLRFRSQELAFADSYSSGLVVVPVDAETLSVSPVFELGEELGRPTIRPHAEGEPILAYVGDFRANKIWVVDVTRDFPRLVAEITGRAYRRVKGRDLSVRTLATPREVVFIRSGDRVYGFVGNYSNSTMALLDVTDPVPQRHCLLARVGRDIDINGESEED